MPRYWIDSDVLIQSANDSYPFDFAPGFWDFLEERIEGNDFCMPAEVARELGDRDDDVAEWVDNRPDGFVVEQDAAVQAVYREVADHVVNGPYAPEHINGFLRRADGWLIAHARVAQGTVVTRERRTGPGGRQVKIPNICDVFEVEAINRDDLLRRYGVRLVRG